MALTPEQRMQIERLYENESLTDNLDDASAQAVLKWAEEQIRADTASQLVTAAVSAANQSGAQGVQALLVEAGTFLARELAVAGKAAAPTTSSDASPVAVNLDQAASTPASAPEGTGSTPASTRAAPARAASGSAAPPNAPSAHADAPAAPSKPTLPSSPPKTRRAKKRKKKKGA